MEMAEEKKPLNAVIKEGDSEAWRESREKKDIIARIVRELKESDVEIDEIKKEFDEHEKEFKEVKEDVEEIRGDVEETEQKVDRIAKAVGALQGGYHGLVGGIRNRVLPEAFQFDDLAQQIVGALVLSAPLAVTQEVWVLAEHLDSFRLLLIVGVTLLFDILLLYYTKYQVVKEERILSFLPTRLFSLIVISYLAAAFMLFTFGVIGGEVTEPEAIAKLIIFVGMFSNIGAGAADLLK